MRMIRLFERLTYPQPPRVSIQPLRRFVDTAFAIADGTGVALVRLSATPFARTIDLASVQGATATSAARFYRWAVQPENLIAVAPVADANALHLDREIFVPPSTSIVVRVTGVTVGAQVSVRVEGPVHGMG
jgi:hypothetical protein